MKFGSASPRVLTGRSFLRSRLLLSGMIRRVPSDNHQARQTPPPAQTPARKNVADGRDLGIRSARVTDRNRAHDSTRPNRGVHPGCGSRHCRHLDFDVPQARGLPIHSHHSGSGRDLASLHVVAILGHRPPLNRNASAKAVSDCG